MKKIYKNRAEQQEAYRERQQFLRALKQPDVQPDETLRELAQRTWSALLAAKDIGVDESGYVPAFNPRTNSFDDWFGFSITDALRPDYFDNHWTSPSSDCTGDEPICIDDLPTLPKLSKRAA